MRRIIFVITILFSALLTFSVQAYDFSADTVIKDKNTTVNGKIFVSGEKTRIEMPEMTLIARIDKKVAYMLMPQQKAYMEHPVNTNMVVSEKFPDEVERKLVGQEKIDGRATDKYLIKIKSEKRTEQVYQWVCKSIKLPIKTAALSGSWSMEFKNIKIGKQSPGLFEVPAGDSKFNMGNFMKMPTK